jgi:hypothetical protein
LRRCDHFNGLDAAIQLGLAAEAQDRNVIGKTFWTIKPRMHRNRGDSEGLFGAFIDIDVMIAQHDGH